MASKRNNTSGGFSGKVGKLVGTSWRGMPIVRSAPKKSSKEPSAAQLLQRAKFRVVVVFLQPIKPFLAQHFGKMEGSRAPFDLAISYHLKEAIKLENGSLMVDFPKMCISKGHLRGLEGVSTTITAGNLLTVRWIDNSDQSFARPDDMLAIILYVPSGAIFHLLENIAPRVCSRTQLTLPEDAVGVQVHCWATFVAFDGVDAATSSYLYL